MISAETENARPILAMIMMAASAVALYLLLFMLTKYLPLLVKNDRRRQWVKKQFVILEIIVWALYVAVMLPVLYRHEQILAIPVTIIITCIIIIWAYYYLRDFISGLIFRMNNHIRKGEYVKTNDIVGIIRKINSLNVEIESMDNRKYIIPYSKINTEVFCRLNDEDYGMTCAFEFKILTDNITPDTLNRMRAFLLSFPAVSTRYEPTIKLKQDDDSTFTVASVTFMSLDKNDNDLIITQLKNNFEKK